MLQLGEKQELVIVKEVEFGVYLAESFESAVDHVLLPIKQVPQDAKVGDKLTVFLYRDSKDRMIATVREPKLTLGKVAELTVVEVGKMGAFLDWGLEKDLFLPYSEQKTITYDGGRVKKGDKLLVTLYVDKSKRLCATTKIYPYLEKNSPYKTGDQVSGKVYETSRNYGAYVAVDNLYSALIPKRELFTELKPGDEVFARVTKVLEDGKLNLSIREKAYLQIDDDVEKILSLLDSYEGSLPFNDKAAPEVIAHETGMSKNQFKRAVGRLLKEGKIEIGEKTIRLK